MIQSLCSLLKTHNGLEIYNCIWIVIHGIQGIVYFKKNPSVPIFTSKCAEMCSDWTHLLEELDRDLAAFLSCLNQHTGAWNRTKWVCLIFFCPRRRITSDYPFGEQADLFCLQLGSEVSTPFRNGDSGPCFKYRRMCEVQQSKILVTKSERCQSGTIAGKEIETMYFHIWINELSK